jgi:hypothetical protein
MLLPEPGPVMSMMSPAFRAGVRRHGESLLDGGGRGGGGGPPLVTLNANWQL